MACGSANVKMSLVDFDPEVVQIKAGKAEVSCFEVVPTPTRSLDHAFLFYMAIMKSKCKLFCYPQIERRISAFIERKQAEINENNVREFCNVIDCNQGNYPVEL